VAAGADGNWLLAIVICLLAVLLMHPHAGQSGCRGISTGRVVELRVCVLFSSAMSLGLQVLVRF
jgi:hypothetical protein